MLQGMQYFAVISMIFTSLSWLVASLFCLRCFNRSNKNQYESDMEIMRLKESLEQAISAQKGMQKTLMNHNDRIDKLTSQVVKLLNNKEKAID